MDIIDLIALATTLWTAAAPLLDDKPYDGEPIINLIRRATLAWILVGAPWMNEGAPAD